MRPCKEHDEFDCPMKIVNRVNGQGPVPCSIMLIGEAPGQTEDKKGYPFCGKSGSEFTYLYLGKCANIDRQNVYVTNLVKCRTNDKDRDPTTAEIKACSHILDDELMRIHPRFIGTMGRLSTQWLLGNVRMEKVHGFGYELGDALVMPLYHPAFGLHNTPMMRFIMEDFRRFGEMVRGNKSIMWMAKGVKL